MIRSLANDHGVFHVVTGVCYYGHHGIRSYQGRLMGRKASQLHRGEGEEDDIRAEFEQQLGHNAHFSICVSVYQIAVTWHTQYCTYVAAAAAAAAAATDDSGGSVAVGYLVGTRPCSSPCVPGFEPKGPKPRKEKKMIKREETE